MGNENSKNAKKKKKYTATLTFRPKLFSMFKAIVAYFFSFVKKPSGKRRRGSGNGKKQEKEQFFEDKI